MRRPGPWPAEPSDQPLPPGEASDPYNQQVQSRLQRQQSSQRSRTSYTSPSGLLIRDVLITDATPACKLRPADSPRATAPNLPPECNYKHMTCLLNATVHSLQVHTPWRVFANRVWRLRQGFSGAYQRGECLRVTGRAR